MDENIKKCIFYGDCPFTYTERIHCKENCSHKIVGKMVRIRYYWQETPESGNWQLTGLMSAKSAKKILKSGFLDRAEIVDDSEYT